MGITFGENAYKQFCVNGIVVSLHWVNHEPAMCLFPARKSLSGSGGVYVIPLDTIYDYLLPNGYPTPYLIQSSLRAAKHMGLDTTKSTISNIADAIFACAQDLIEMPPEPDSIIDRHFGLPIGEATIKVDGTTIFHNEVTVPEGMH